MLPGGPGSMILAVSVRGYLDEAWKLHLALGYFFRPNADLLAILPLQHQPSDKAFAVFDRMGERIVLAVELNAADCTDPVSFLECIHELVGVAGASAFHRVGDIVDFVVGGVSGIG